MASKLIEDKLGLLPSEPGSYQFKDKNGLIIYVGKAKNLRNRVRSYFKADHTGKTAELVSNIADLDFIVTNSDKEAFLIENTLIKQHKPRFNIRLKYGSSYPYIEITKGKYPKAVLANSIKKNNSEYFGPYPNVYAAQQTLEFLYKVYPLVRCNGYQGRPCLYYSMNQCIGACFKEIPQEEYDERINQIRKFLNGDIKVAENNLTEKITQASSQLDFERAGQLRDQLNFIKITVENQRMLGNDLTSRDIFNYHVDKGWMTVSVFFLRQAKLMRQQKETFAMIADPEDELATFIGQFYQQKSTQLPKEILIPKNIDAKSLEALLNIDVRIPQRGEKKELLELAGKNAKIALEEKLRLMTINDLKNDDALNQLSNALKIDKAYRIEAFDHSNLAGTDIVSAMVVFDDGVPNKDLYRRFKIKTIDQQNEYAATQEIIRRRYSRVLKEKTQLPDLILVDGGVIQLDAARDVLENELDLQIPIAAMVKNDKHKTADLIGVVEDENTKINLDTTSQGFFLVQRIQDEVHRFAISFMKTQHKRTTFNSQLDDVVGVGPKTRTKLFQHFGSIDKITGANLEELEELGISHNTAILIKMIGKKHNKAN